MRKVTIIDYIGNSDKSGKPLGHPIKVIRDYYNLLHKDTKVKLIVSKNYKDEIGIKNSNQIIYLDYFMNMLANSKFDKIKNIINRILNLRKVFQNSSDDEILWFINVDKILYIYLYLFRPKYLGDIWITQYSMIYGNNNSLKNRILKKISHSISNKFTWILSYNKKVTQTYKNTICIPDYFYDEVQFKKYRDNIKLNEVIAIGTILDSKDFEGLINAFRNIEVKLNIVGKFHDRNRFERLKNMIGNSENIILKDLELSYDQYYEIMSKYKYVILPYKIENYFERTSGVLIEAKLIGAIPIAPKYLLKFNGVNGIAYEHIDDLERIFKNVLNGMSDEISNFNECIDIYNSKTIKQKIIEKL